MSIISERKKLAVNNIYKSDIFNQTFVQQDSVKIRENLKSQISFNIMDNPNKDIKTKVNNNFEPLYKSDNPYNRYMKEFGSVNYNKNNINNNSNSNLNQPTKNSIGLISNKRKEENCIVNRKDFSDLNYKEKKIQDLFPYMTNNQVKEFIKKQEENKKKLQKLSKVEENNKKGSNAKESYYRQTMESNVFDDEDKLINKSFSNNYNSYITKKVSNKINLNNNDNNKMKVKPKKDISSWVNNLDWKNIDSTVYFNNKDKFDLNPSSVKQKELSSNFKIAFDKKPLNTEFNNTTTNYEISNNNQNLNEEQLNNKIKNKISNEIKSSLNNQRETKVKKTIDLASNTLGPEFYNKNYNKASINSKPIIIEVKDIDNFHNFNFKDIKDCYAKEGLHIFGYKEKTSVSTGYNKGTITYKIRPSNNNNFDIKCNNVKNVITSKGIKLQEVKENENKPKNVGICLPINIKWDDNRIKNMTSKMTSYESTKENAKVINKNDRISNHVLEHSYKQNPKYKRVVKKQELDF